MPTVTQAESPASVTSIAPSKGKIGEGMWSAVRSTSATTAATATGMKLRGVHSKSRSSTASMMAAIGVPKTVVMPAAAPATSSVLRSLSLTGSAWAISDPIAPPVMMIGPSAPNGPPVPMAIAEESGLRIATLTSSRERPSRMASIASGMPWPRILSLP